MHFPPLALLLAFFFPGRHVLRNVDDPSTDFTITNPSTGIAIQVRLKLDTGSGFDVLVPYRTVEALGIDVNGPQVRRNLPGSDAGQHPFSVTFFGNVRVSLILENPNTSEQKVKEGLLGLYSKETAPPPASSPIPESVFRRPVTPPEWFFIGYQALRQIGVDWKMYAGILYEIQAIPV